MHSSPIGISAVIPTRNRRESLFRLLRSLRAQNYQLKEIIIVDSSDIPISPLVLSAEFPELPIMYETSPPAADVQRNRGIRLATASHIFLCDDDLEVPKNYLARLSEILEKSPDIGAISGLCFELDGDGRFQYSFPTIKFRNLVWQFIFQLTVWADVSKTTTNLLARPILLLLQRFYSDRGNTYTLAGWPLVTQVQSPLFRTSVFSLGGSVIRRDWLLKSPYDEILDTYGIGDNYGVALNFPQRQPIVITTENYVLHHKVSGNRLPKPVSYFRRILALHYFMKTSEKFSTLNRVCLLWSLIGNAIYQMVKYQPEMLRATLKAMKLIATAKNPYLSAKRAGDVKAVSPTL